MPTEAIANLSLAILIWFAIPVFEAPVLLGLDIVNPLNHNQDYMRLLLGLLFREKLSRNGINFTLTYSLLMSE